MIRVSNHAIDRYIERFGGSRSSGSQLKRINRMRKVVSFGVELKPKRVMYKLLKNNLREAKYYLYRNIVAVVGDNSTVLTVYEYNPEKWEKLPINKNAPQKGRRKH